MLWLPQPWFRGHLHAEPTVRGGSVILVTFRHPNPQIVQPVLQAIIDAYFQKHYEIHQAVGQFDESLSRERADLQLQLGETDTKLAELKNNAKILSLDDTRNNLANQISKIQNSILDAEAELGQYGIAASEAEKPAVTLEATNAQAVVPAEQIQAYQDSRARLNYLQQKEQSYISQGFTPENVLVKELAKQVADAGKKVGDFEKEYPQLIRLGSSPAMADNHAATPDTKPPTKSETIAALKAKIGAWNWQLNQLFIQASNVNNLAPVVARLEQTRQIQGTNYGNLAVQQELAHINEVLTAAGKAPNIRWVQTPSPSLSGMG